MNYYDDIPVLAKGARPKGFPTQFRKKLFIPCPFNVENPPLIMVPNNIIPASPIFLSPTKDIQYKEIII